MGSPDVNDDPEKLVPTATNTSTGVPRAGSVGDIVGEDVEADGKYGKTKRGLKSRHAQMIALGGSIGTGLFVGTGRTLATGGPAFILAGFIIMSALLWCIVTAITEVASYMPIHGASMAYYGHRYVSRSMGFALGWLYWYALGILVPYEITAAGLVIDYWENPVNIGVWMTVMLIVIVGLNVLPVSYYGETEFWFASTKVLLMVGLLILSFILFWGGVPSQPSRLGFRYWERPGAVIPNTRDGDIGLLISFWITLVYCVFPFVFAPELIIVTAGEMQSPRRNLPIAARRYFYRLIGFYILGVLAIGVICPSDDSRLTDGGAGAGSSPFVVGIANAGIDVLPSIVNAVILLSAWSSGNSFLYMSIRSLYSLSIAGNAPRIFKKCTKKGVPIYAVAVSSLFAPLSYLNVSNESGVVFDWFVNLTNTWGLISWVCCMIIFVRFRKACRVHGVQSPYRNWIQPYGAWTAMVAFTILCLINGFTVFFPQNWSASGFLTAYVGLPVFVVMYVGHRIWARRDKWAHDPRDIDMFTGLQEVEDAELPYKPRKGFGKLWKVIE